MRQVTRTAAQPATAPPAPPPGAAADRRRHRPHRAEPADGGHQHRPGARRRLEHGLGISSGLAGLVTTMPVLCFAAIGFAGPGAVRPLPRLARAQRRPGHDGGRPGGPRRRAAPSGSSCVGTVLAMVGGALGNVLLPSLVKRYFPRPHRPDGRRVQHRHVASAATVAAVADRADRRRRRRRRLALGARRLGGLRPARRGRPGCSSRRTRAPPAARTPPSGCATSGTAGWRWRSWCFFGVQGHGGLHHHRLVGPVPPRRRADARPPPACCSASTRSSASR